MLTSSSLDHDAGYGRTRGGIINSGAGHVRLISNYIGCTFKGCIFELTTFGYFSLLNNVRINTERVGSDADCDLDVALGKLFVEQLNCP